MLFVMAQGPIPSLLLTPLPASEKTLWGTGLPGEQHQGCVLMEKQPAIIEQPYPGFPGRNSPHPPRRAGGSGLPGAGPAFPGQYFPQAPVGLLPRQVFMPQLAAAVLLVAPGPGPFTEKEQEYHDAQDQETAGTGDKHNVLPLQLETL